MVLPEDNPTPSETFDFVGMLLLSPGLALFLYGVSSIPEAGTVWRRQGARPGARSAWSLVVAFVLRSLFRAPEHPLIDLHLFRNRALTVAVIAMSLFAIAFFGASLLFPSYFLQVRGETTLQAGLLLAPAGHRRDADDAGRRRAGRQDRPRQDRAGRHRGDHGRHGDVHPGRRRTHVRTPFTCSAARCS